MKRKLLNLLLMLTLGVSGAWAEEINATLDQTIGAQWGSNTAKVTENSEKEHFNLATSTGWAGSAFAKFSFEVPAGKTIVSASLTWGYHQNNNSAQTTDIYYLNKDTEVDINQTAGSYYLFSSNRTFLCKTEAMGQKGGKDYTGLKTDVTSAIRAMYSNGQSYVYFMWTANSGSGDLFGKGSATNAPSLVITIADVVLVDYTVNYVYEEGTIKSDDGTALVGATVNATLPITIEGQKYYAVNDAKTSMNIDADAANNILNVNLRKANVYSYSVKNSLGETLLSGDNAIEGEQISVDYPRYVYNSSEKILYKANSGSGARKYTFYQTANGNIDETISYTKNVSGVVYFTEAEDVAGATVYNSCNGTYNNSSGSLAVFNNYTYLTTLPAGKYKLYVREFGRVDRYFNFATDVDGTNLIWKNVAFSGWNADMNEHVSDEIVLEAETSIFFKGGYATTSNNGQVVDLFYIQRVDVDPVPGTDASGVIVNPHINGSASGWTTNKTSGGNGPYRTNNNQMEYWAGNATDRDAAGFDYYQTIINLPNGYYTLSADMCNSLNGEAGAEFNESCGLYAVSGDNSVMSYVTSEGGEPLTNYTTQPILVENGTLRIGVKSDKRMGARWFVADNFRLTYVGNEFTLPVTIGQYGYATYVTPYNMDFTDSKITAYTVSNNIENDMVTITPVDGQKVPAGTALVLKGETDDINVTAEAVGAVATDLTYSDVAITDATKDAGKTYYYLGVENGTVVFRPLAAGKCFFTVDASSGAKSLRIAFDNDNTTGAAVTEANAVKANGKYVENGQIVIINNGKTYNVAGIRK